MSKYHTADSAGRVQQLNCVQTFNPLPENSRGRNRGWGKKYFWYRRLAGAWLFLILAAGRAWALDPEKSVDQFNCKSWSRQSGLPFDKITAIAQAKNGFLWFGTQNGLVRYDGSDFKVFPIDLPAAKGQEVSSVAASRNGGLWLAVKNGEFGGFDGQNFTTLGDDKANLSVIQANVILESRAGVIWGGSDFGLNSWVKDKPGDNLLDQTVPMMISVCEDPAGRIWIGTAEHGLCNSSNGKLNQIADDTLKQQFLYSLAADANGQIWVGTANGLYCRDAKGKDTKVPAITGEVKALLVDSHGILWAGTSGAGLARCQNGVFTFLKKADGLAGDYVTALCEDAEGSLWVGTREGLSQLTDLKFPTCSSRAGINDGSTTSVSASRKGGLWITTATGLSWFDGKTSRNYTNDPTPGQLYLKVGYEARNGDVYVVDANKTIDVLTGDKFTAFYTNSIWADAISEDDESILAGIGGSLFRIENRKLTPYVFRQGQPRLYWINNIHVTRDGVIWLASNNGICRIQNGNYKKWLDERVNCLFEDPDGTIWAGLATGIARIKDGQLKKIKQVDGIFDDRIYSIIADDHGYFWFNSGNGIFRATRQSLNEFADGKSPQVACEAFTGLESVKLADRIDQEPSGCRTTDGRIWFPNPKGVVMIDPDRYFTNRIAPRVFIQQILVNGQELKNRNEGVFHAGDKRLEFDFTALSYISPGKMQVQYQLTGQDPAWVNAGTRRSALYDNLQPGTYKFQVRAANADGVWNETGDSFSLVLPPPFYQTIWFRALYVLSVLLALWGVYRWKVRLIERRERQLEDQNDQLEVKVSERTAELHQEIEKHKHTERELKQRTRALEHEIEERKRMQLEMERVHQELVEASRMAGMAEVATGVLHNVGNVLNSVNVSTTLLTQHVKKSKVGSVGQVAAMLKENAATLGEFMSQDPKGKRLPGFLASLAEHLATEQKVALEELQGLQKNMEHIREIVSMQQAYAKFGGVTQVVKISELVEDALRINETSLTRHAVQVSREYDASLPETVIDKHKVMQILINLISNAKYACNDSDQKSKHLTLRVQNGEARIKISIIDNGVGIPKENLNRIFNHGFTTRKTGHGFGLHSGALAAKEMGGALTVHSDGPGTGARFILELPLQPLKK
jgi:ligand-binding sensor domain-containing protein/signal transduction histidine kinase